MKTGRCRKYFREVRGIGLFVLLCLVFGACDDSDDDNIMVTDPIDSIYFPPTNSDQWQTVAADSLGWHTGKLDELTAFVESTNSRALIVLKNGKIVFEHYYGKDLFGATFQKNSEWYWASAGKSLIGFLSGQAQESGYVHLEAPSSTYLGEGWSDLDPLLEAQIKVKHHLSMTTGLDDNTENKDCTEPECFSYLQDAGTRWAYHNGPYTITHELIENAVGQSFDTYFNTQLRDPIGMDGRWIYLGENHVYTSTARSMARFGLLVMNEGRWDDQVLLSDSDYFQSMLTSSQSLNPSYGYLWWLNGQSSYIVPGTQLTIPTMMIPSAPAKMWIAAGKNGQLINIIPEEGLVVVRMGEGTESSFVSLNYMNELWGYLNQVLP